MNNHNIGNREIKFRAWHTRDQENGKMITEIIGFKDGTVNGCDSTDVLLQYTGLKDSKGVEIYESDVVSSPQDDLSEHNPVVWSNNKGCWMVGDQVLYEFNSEDLEIIGNIFENESLLNN